MTHEILASLFRERPSLCLCLLSLSAEEEARLDACTDLDALDAWLERALTA